MISKKPGFSKDCARHGLFGAIRKRWFSVTLSGRSWKYAELLKLPEGELMELLSQALSQWNQTGLRWVFEALLIRSGGDLAGCWDQAAPHFEELRSVADPGGALERRHVKMAEQLLRYVDNPESFKQRVRGCYCNYLFGLVYSSLARGARGVNKSDLQKKKALALHYLGKARKSTDEDLEAVLQFPALAPAIAAAYETTAYLAYKGTRTTALSE